MSSGGLVGGDGGGHHIGIGVGGVALLGGDRALLAAALA